MAKSSRQKRSRAAGSTVDPSRRGHREKRSEERARDTTWRIRGKEYVGEDGKGGTMDEEERDRATIRRGEVHNLERGVGAEI